MSIPLTVRRAFRKLVRPVRNHLRGEVAQFELAQLGGPVLVVIAHPDDEAFCSGLICALREAGTEVHLLCMTRGEGGERAGDGSAELGSVREREMFDAARSIGVEHLQFMGYIDPQGEGSELMAPEVDRQKLIDQLSEAIRSCGAKSIVTHGSSGEYWHPAHLCLHDAACGATRDLDDVSLWTFNAWDEEHPLGNVLNRDDPAQLTVDAAAFHKRRLESLSCHASQRAVFERFAGSDLETFVRKTARENYHLRDGEILPS